MFQNIINEHCQRCLRNTCALEFVNQLLPECVCSLFIVNILFITIFILLSCVMSRIVVCHKHSLLTCLTIYRIKDHQTCHISVV